MDSVTTATAQVASLPSWRLTGPSQSKEYRAQYMRAYRARRRKAKQVVPGMSPSELVARLVADHMAAVAAEQARAARAARAAELGPQICVDCGQNFAPGNAYRRHLKRPSDDGTPRCCTGSELQAVADLQFDDKEKHWRTRDLTISDPQLRAAATRKQIKAAGGSWERSDPDDTAEAEPPAREPYEVFM